MSSTTTDQMPAPTLRSRLADSTNSAYRWLLLLTFVGVLVANLPGHMSVDSVVQLYEARFGEFGSGNPAFVSWFMGLTDAVLPGTSLYVAVVAAMLWLALSLISRLGFRLDPAILIGLVFVSALPHIVVYQGIVWKDIIFANSLVLGFAILVVATRRRGRGAGALVVLAGVVMVGIVQSRQNGLVALPIAGVCVMLVGDELRLRRRIVHGLAWVIVVYVSIIGMTNYLERFGAKPAGESQSGHIRSIHSWDIVGVVARNPDAPIEDLKDKQLIEGLRATATAGFSPTRIDTMGWEPMAPLWGRLWELDDETIEKTWRTLVREDTGTYVRHRISVFHWMVSPPDIGQCLPLWIGVEGPPDKAAILELPNIREPQDRALYNYSVHFFDDLVYDHAAWIVLSGILLVPLLWRRRRPDVVVAALVVASGLLVLTYLPFGAACDYRYLYFSDVSTMFALLYVLGTFPITPGIGRGARRISRVRPRFRRMQSGD